MNSISDLFNSFTDYVSPENVIHAKLASELSVILSKERINRGLSQKKFAKLLDVKQSQVSSWEHGDINFSLSTIAKIAARLNLNINITTAYNKPSTAYTPMGRFTYNSTPYSTIYVSAPNRYESRSIAEREVV